MTPVVKSNASLAPPGAERKTLVTSFLSRLSLEALSLSGVAKLAALRGRQRGVIIHIRRVRPPRFDAFQPNRADEVTPQALDALIKALPGWGFDIVAIDDALARIAQPRTRRVAVLTFDGFYRDVGVHAWGVLMKNRVPSTIYIAAGFADGIADPWWLALERVIATQNRMGLVMNGREQLYGCGTVSEKQQLFDLLWRWMRALPAEEQAAAIRDLCSRYSVDFAAIVKQNCITWPDIMSLAGDPLVTLASATLHHFALPNLAPSQAGREIKMGRDVLETALGRAVPHLAFPFGEAKSREVSLASGLGFASAVTGEQRLLGASDAQTRCALPRLTWDGRLSLRAFRAKLAGL
jgi:peptidoglycan/xylan/chitin deacetylase (PgdA/CDA1 family)